jgi:hypothetical protein
MKIIIVFIMILSPVVSFSLERDAIETKLYIDSTFKRSGQSIEERVIELDKIKFEINKELELNEFDSELLFFKGMVIRQYAYTFKDPITSLDLEKLKLIGVESDTWLLKSIENGMGGLTVSQLYMLKGSSLELAVKTIDEIISRDKRLIEDDRIVELKRQKIDNLIRLGRFGEARDEMIETNQEHPAFKSTEWDEAFEGQILEVQAKLKATQEKEADTPIEKPEEKPIKNQVVTADTTVDEEMNPMVLNEDSSPRLIQLKSVLEQYGIFILAFFVFLGMYFFSNRKSKK